MMSRLQANLLLLLTAALWGFAFVPQKTAMAAVGPLTFIFARCTLAAFVLAPLALREAHKAKTPIDRRFAILTIATALVFLSGAAFQQYGLQTATVTNASFLTALYAVCVPFVVWIVFGKPPPQIVWFAAGLSFVGVWLLGGARLEPLTGGDRLVAACAVLWAFHIVLSGLASHYDRPLLFTAAQFPIVAIMAVVGMLTTEAASVEALWAVWPEILYVGVISSALTFTLFAVALRHAPPAEAAIILSSENIFAAVAGAILLGERLAWINWSGAVIILTAIVITQIAVHRR
jgi:drug/metabolite transporter (DMT)-like permease